MNIYIQIISGLSQKNKYFFWWQSIIERSTQRATTREEAKALLGYVEGHHIVPKSFKLGGETDKDNIVYLTSKEHIIVHHLMCKFLTGEHKTKSLRGFYRMCYSINKYHQRNPHVSKRLLLESRKAISKANRGYASAVCSKTKKRLGKVKITDPRWKTGEIVSTSLGWKDPEQTRRNKSLAHRGKNNNMWGKTHTKEARRKIRENRIYDTDGKKNPNAKKWKIVSPANEVFIVEGEFEKFCYERDIAPCVLANSAKKNRKVVRGKAAGWQAFYI